MSFCIQHICDKNMYMAPGDTMRNLGPILNSSCLAYQKMKTGIELFFCPFFLAPATQLSYLDIVRTQYHNTVFVMVCKKKPLTWDLISSNSNRCARARHTNIYCKRNQSWIAASFQTLHMLKAGVRKCVYFYFREEIKKKKAPCSALALCLSQL